MGRRAKNPVQIVAPISSKKQLLGIKAVCIFLGGIGEDSLLRVRNDPKERFPQPVVVIDGGPMWSIDQLERFKSAIPSRETIHRRNRPSIGFHEIPISESVSGIYFLCDRQAVVYVGQSLDVPMRICRHKREATKSFESVFVLPCAREKLDEQERRFITLFNPKYNSDAATLAMRRNGGRQMATVGS